MVGWAAVPLVVVAMLGDEHYTCLVDVGGGGGLDARRRGVQAVNDAGTGGVRGKFCGRGVGAGGGVDWSIEK